MPIKEMIEIERRWLLADSINMKQLGWDKFDITQIYLERHIKGTERIRMSLSSNGERIYTHTIKEPLEIGQLEKEEIISENKFNELMKRINLKHQMILKTRYVKEINNLRFEVDEFSHPFATKILEVELSSWDDVVKIPDCLGRCIEITGIKMLSNFNLSLKPKAAKKRIAAYIEEFLEKEKLKTII